MQAPEIVARPRSVIGKQTRALRRAGELPAILYGQGIEPTPLELDGRDAARVLSGVTESTLIDLKLDGETHKVLVRALQFHPIRHNLLHVDFLKVAMDVAIRTVVPIELVGEAPAVRTLGGVLVTGVSEIEVEALPADLPDRIVVSLESLGKIDDSIVVRNIPVSESVRVLTGLDELIARVIFQAEEKVEEVAAETLIAASVEPKVIEKGKKEEEIIEEEESGRKSS